MKIEVLTTCNFLTLIFYYILYGENIFELVLVTCTNSLCFSDIPVRHIRIYCRLKPRPQLLKDYWSRTPRAKRCWIHQIFNYVNHLLTPRIFKRFTNRDDLQSSISSGNTVPDLPPTGLIYTPLTDGRDICRRVENNLEYVYNVCHWWPNTSYVIF